MSTIDKLKSVIGKRGGLAKSNRFNVIFTPPTQSLLNLNSSALIGVLAGGQSVKSLISDPRDISLLCQGANIPGRQITTIDYQSEKQVVPIPYAIIDEDVTLKFLLTNDYYIKRMMDDWDNIEHFHKHLLGPMDLLAGTYLGEYPERVKGGVEALRKMK